MTTWRIFPAKTAPVFFWRVERGGVGGQAAEESVKGEGLMVAVGLRVMTEVKSGSVGNALSKREGAGISHVVATEADIANGTRGEIQDIILDEREESSVADEEGIVQLKYPPAMLLFKPDRISTLVFPGLPAGIIPLSPSQVKFTVTGRSGKKFKVKRSQYAMTAGYAFTDYKSQGQTIEYVIIDIGRLPTGSLSPFSVNVALSRSRGRETIRLLRDFDPNLFQNYPSEALREDMKRLERLNEETKRNWQTRQTGQKE